MPPLEMSVLTRNRLLATLTADELARLAEILTPRDFEIGEIVHESRQRIREVMFPLDAVMSVVAEAGDGEQVEAGLIGNEGVAGIAPFLGADTSVLRTLCQLPGSALVADVDELLAQPDGELAMAVRRYAYTLLTMASQGAACNRVHSVEQRAARWLLMVADRVERSPFEMTHEFFAIMLGTTRPTVSLAAISLRRAGLIDYARGRITILDRNGLEEVACECYGTITDEYERMTGARLRPGPADLRPMPRLVTDLDEEARGS